MSGHAGHLPIAARGPSPDVIAEIMPEASPVRAACEALGPEPLTQASLERRIFPLFSRVLERSRREIYLSNHSLGRPLDQTAEDIAGAVDAWYRDLDGAWELWERESRRFRANVARLLGLARADAVVPKTSAAQGLRAVLGAISRRPPSVLCTTAEFDSIDYVLRMHRARGRAKVRMAPPDEHGLFHADALIDHIDETVDLVVVSHVVFSSGQIIEGLDRIIEAAHDCGSLVLVDAYHSAGAIPWDFDGLDPDFVIGGSYKYTRGGPGACWLAINPRHLEGPVASRRLVPIDTGWFAKKDPFGYTRESDPLAQLAPDGNGWLESTPPVLTPLQAKAGLELTLGIGVARLREYNLGQQDRLAGLLGERRVPMRLLEPRGNYLLVPHADAFGFARELHGRGVSTDARRTPDGATCVRLCPDLLTTEDELVRAADIIGAAYR